LTWDHLGPRFLPEGAGRRKEVWLAQYLRFPEQYLR
jgi:hypothetical protein